MCSRAAIAGILTLAGLVRAQAPRIIIRSPWYQEKQLIYSVRPVYPRLARQARIEGTVELAAVIDETGRVERLRLIRGHPLLVKAAMDAVKQWRYRPALWNGVPVAVRTTIWVNFTLGTGTPPSRGTTYFAILISTTPWEGTSAV